MIDKLIGFSIRNKLIIGMFVLALIGWGAYSLQQIPIDAVPDITTNQVQLLTQSPTLAAQEVEQFITFPIEIAMSNLPKVVEIRSTSRFGISVVTVVFEEDMDIYLARQLISEQLKTAEKEIPAGFGTPELGPITTGLGEVYQYVLHKQPGYEEAYSDMDLRTINDWIVKRQLAGTPGVIEVNGWGGHLKQYEVAVNPSRLNSMNITVAEVFDALEANNENTGGSYIERRFNTYFIRGEGLVKSLEDIEKIVVKSENGIPVLIRDIAKVSYGSSPRMGAITYNGQGEVVGGQALMLKGENSFDVVKAVKERIEIINESLPEGVIIEPYIDRSKLIGRAINTVTTNLVEGGLIVILVLVFLLGNLRGGLIVASVIPLSMLFAMAMMNVFGVSANLMSLGAIDFGLVVDGSVIIVEAILHRLTSEFSGQRLDQKQLDEQVLGASTRIRSSAAFGEIIILIVYLPILALVGIEGKMFKPMAQTVSFAILGALILSMTYVPMMSALFLSKNISSKRTLSDRLIDKVQSIYSPSLHLALKSKSIVVIVSVGLFLMSLFTFNRLGGEFIPTLEEGDFALHQILPPGSSLQQSVEVSQKIQRLLLDSFPEVEMAVSKIGTAEIPTDPMPIEVGDIMVHMAPKEEWVSASTKQEMFEKMERVLNQIPGVEYEFTQPIQMRFNELIAGIREDIAIKIFGENPDILHQKAGEVQALISGIDGIGDLRVEQTKGLPQMVVRYNRSKLAQYDLDIRTLNRLLRAAFAGESAGVVFEEERRFDLVVRLDERSRQSIEDIRNLYIPLSNGRQIPLKEVADVNMEEGPMQISRDNAKRRIVIGVNARNRDTESLVNEIQEKLHSELDLPPGYYVSYGGQFENMIAAKKRLYVAVPVALLLILVLLFFTFQSVKQALLIFTAIPLSAIGGIYALWLRDMPFSISAGVGFIALFGVAVLNGIVLIAYFNQLKKEGIEDVHERIVVGTRVRLRPVLMTASVAALGFLPMALSTSGGAEVQRPLATVVIGGLISATLLTLLVLPVLYSLIETWKPGASKSIAYAVLLVLSMGSLTLNAQEPLSLDQAISMAKENHPSLRAAQLGVEQQEKLKKTAFDLDKTQINYSRGEINLANVNDYQWQISQRFKFPTTYVSQAKLQREKVALSEKALAITELEMERNVRSAWTQLSYAKEAEQMMAEVAEVFSEFAEAASKRFEAGDINALEKVTAQSQLEQVLIRRKQAQADALAARQQLQQWLGTDTSWVFPNQALEPIAIPASSNGGGNATVDYYRQRSEIAQREHRLSQSAFLPDLSVGYINQQIESIGGTQAFQFGVGLPIFFWTEQGKAQAAKIGSEMAAADLETWQLSTEAAFQKRSQELRKYRLQLDWYESTGEKTANELLRFARKAYREGEIGYLEFIQTTAQAVTIKTEYLNTVNLYNQSIIDLQYLAGNFN
ncbi:MAG: CusA/CzcA family heavy metal efflux RND transporter [Flavobacteriales bacterium]